MSSNMSSYQTELWVRDHLNYLFWEYQYAQPGTLFLAEFFVVVVQWLSSRFSKKVDDGQARHRNAQNRLAPAA